MFPLRSSLAAYFIAQAKKMQEQGASSLLIRDKLFRHCRDYRKLEEEILSQAKSLLSSYDIHLIQSKLNGLAISRQQREERTRLLRECEQKCQ